MPKHGAKAPGVVQQKPGVVKQPLDVVMLAAWLIQRHASQRARHAEVDDHGSVLEVEQQVLAPPFTALHDLAGNLLGQVGGDGPAHAWFVNQQSASAERRVGKGGVSTFRYRWVPY